MTQNAKGPAATGIAPDRGSNHSSEETKMNSTETTTMAAKAPAPRPTDAQVASAMRDLNTDIGSLRLAVMVLAEYASYEFRAGQVDRGKEKASFHLTYEQKVGIEYMLFHVEDLATKVERAFDAALDGKVR
ncbi:hypothetical protein [Neorhizobium galegae]|uniref:hypothetical protein n=1 Tax=Neorhizobium galegae TaxID=399 RepID=UPI001F1A5481|nr:hypothetical protein [Neorhizobium galegae]UIK05032.1 hypothetical protein LZK81_20645 [Neorhizobium galegae]